MSNSIAVERWMGRLALSTRVVQANYFKAFMGWLARNGGDFAEFTPDQLIEYQAAADNGNRYRLLDLAQRYVLSVPGTFNTKNSRYNNIRSFFLHNRAELPRDPHFNLRPEREPIQGTLTAENIRDAIMGCKPVYRAIYLSMFQGALDQEMFTHWNLSGYESLIQQLKADPETVRIDLPGRKHRKNMDPYYTFIGGDAIDAIRTWLKLRPPEAQAIFVGQYGEPLDKSSLRKYWVKRLRLLGIVDPVKPRTRADKTGMGLHEMRDVWRSLWDKSPASSTVAEYCMGHQIDPLEYNKSFRDVEHYRREYVKALPYLQIMTGGDPFGKVDKNEVERLKLLLNEAEKKQIDELTELREKYNKLEKMLERIMNQTEKELKP